MIKKCTIFLLLLSGIVFFVACSGEDSTSSEFIGNYDPDGGPPPPPPPSDNSNDTKYKWDIPANEIVTGCLGTDCIPSLQDPELISVDQVDYLDDNDLLEGIFFNNQARAYPHKILDWHEIINQHFGSTKIAITYCPLTGSAVGIHVSKTGLSAGTSLKTFGISGLLYNNNLIPYDRGTLSNWSQMLLRCVNGVLRGTPMVTVPLIETSWKTWKKMFPNSLVVSTNTGFDRPYNIFPYGNYKTDPFLLFPISIDDTRRPRKERLYGVITDPYEFKAKTYPHTLFPSPRAINDEVDGNPVVIAGSKPDEIFVSYSRITEDGTLLTFDVSTESPHIFPFDLVDNEGNVWNILGEAVEGPRQGQHLKPMDAYNAYWFAWGTFFPGVPIYSE
ncbi:MAG: DUF3179 domain-containing protein [Calditrichaeota bacterium]|nr:MAG: DUF3179 domain-containing protein [Calditrichota bacterium]